MMQEAWLILKVPAVPVNGFLKVKTLSNLGQTFHLCTKYKLVLYVWTQCYIELPFTIPDTFPTASILPCLLFYPSVHVLPA